ncbi:MAG: alpha/beta hydrolase [Balneola sp.]
MVRFISILAIIICCIDVPTHAQELPRRASFNAQISWPNNSVPGAKINVIPEDSPLKRAGFESNDIILYVNERFVGNSEDWGAITYGLRANEEIKIVAKRGNRLIDKTVTLKGLPKEENKGVETLYEVIVNGYGQMQRSIITKPESGKKLPAIILIQGLSCSTIEKFSERSNNWGRLISNIAEKSNMVFMRVDKPGVGDSEGDCGEVDFKTELSGYEAAVRELKTKAYVDTTKIVVYGNSMGSAIAPYLANKYNLAGVISDGTFFKTWYEHMLEIERRILKIEGKSQAEILKLFNEVYIPLYHGMLIEKKSFEEIIEENPTYATHHRQGLNHMYGRSMKYYHQVQDFNFAKEWETIKVPVRIRWGTNDWIMSEFDNDMIIEVLKSSGHEDHELYKYPGLDHWSTIHPDYSSSFNFKPGAWEEMISQQIIDWAWEIVQKTD